MKKILRDERGFLAIQLFSIMIVIVFSVASFLAGAAFAAKRNAVMTYDWFGTAMDYAASAANREKDLKDAASNTNLAKRYFGLSFSQMTNSAFNGNSFTPKGKSMYSGPIRLISFNYTPPGQTIPGGTARQPGYTAIIEVPVLSCNLPFIGQQHITVPMRYFGVVKSEVVKS